MDPTIITAIVGVFGGGFLVKLAERWIPSADKKMDVELVYVQQLKGEVDRLTARVEILEKHLAAERQRYEELLIKYTRIERRVNGE